jgi:hypothetical protein
MVMDRRVRSLRRVVLTGSILAYLGCAPQPGGYYGGGPGGYYGGGGPPAMEHNVDRPGNDFSNTVQPDANQCRAVCMTIQGCAAWTWVRPGVLGPQPRCYLKNPAPPPVPNGCCISGVKTAAAPPPAPGGLEYNMDRPGNDFSNTVQPNAQQCQAVCKTIAGCAAWTWVKPGIQGPSPRCYLKNPAPPPVPNACCVSGLK